MLNFMKSFGLLLAVLVLSGCQNQVQVDPDVDFSHVYPQAATPVLSNGNQGSIYAQGFKMNLFGNAREWKIGDLITVTVKETATLKTSADNSAQRKADSTVATPKIFGMTPSAGDVNLDMSLATDNKFDGKYSQNQSQTITFTITATVAHVFPNGNLLIKGEKEFYSNGTKEFMCLHGIARPDDILADNTIIADKLGDLKLQMGQNGKLFKGAEPGWLTKLLSVVYPF